MTRQIKRTMGSVWIAGVLMTGCIQAALDEWHALTAAEPSTGIGSSSSTGTPDMDPTGGIQTVTSATSSTGPGGPVETSGGPQNENPPPVIELFSVTPTHRSEAGPAVLELLASQDVVKVQLRLGDKILAELTPADFPYTYEVLSAKFNFVHDFEVVVTDAEGLTDDAMTTLTVNVPQTGMEKCLFTDETAVWSQVGGVVYADDAIVAVGARDDGTGRRLTVWKLDPDHCEVVLPGWPKSMVNWNPALNAVLSAGTALALDEDGNIAVAGFTLAGLTPQRYLVMLTPEGSPLWDVHGAVGEEISGVVVAPKPKAAVLAVGWRRSGPNAMPTDAMIWNYKLDGIPVPPDALVAPFTPDEPFGDPFNERSEWARAVVVAPSGKAIVIGEREFQDENADIYTRTFAARLDPLTGLFGEPWTSPGKLFNDSAANLAVCGSELIAAGWWRDWPPDAEPSPLLQWFATDTSPLDSRPIPLSATRLRGVACDREGKVISAGVQEKGKTDSKVFAITKDDTLVWYETGTVDDDQANSVSCDRRGFCAWGGFRTKDGKRFAVVRGHHP